MPEKSIDSSASGCLVIIFPLAFVIAVLFVAWPVLLALVIVGASLKIWQRYQWQKWVQQINPFFHKLIQENQGCITAMDLAMKANLSGAAAKQYLETKVKEFGAIAQEYPERGTVYYFVTSATLGSIFDNSEPPSFYDSEDIPTAGQRAEFAEAGKVSKPANSESSSTESNLHLYREDFSSENFQEWEDSKETSSEDPRQSQAIIQSELARRLEVHSSTVHKRKFEPDFPDWSRSRDPQGIAWEFSPTTKLFFPQGTEPQDIEQSVVKTEE